MLRWRPTTITTEYEAEELAQHYHLCERQIRRDLAILGKDKIVLGFAKWIEEVDYYVVWPEPGSVLRRDEERKEKE